MSSFICSNNHFRQLRKNTYHFILSNRYVLCGLGKDYNTDINEIKALVNYNIYQLYKLNVASVNLQYRDTQKNKVYEDYDNNIGNEILTDYSAPFSMEKLVSLYNAYSCLDYQIELNYDKTFINTIKSYISNEIIYKINDYYKDNNIEINKWEY